MPFLGSYSSILQYLVLHAWLCPQDPSNRLRLHSTLSISLADPWPESSCSENDQGTSALCQLLLAQALQFLAGQTSWQVDETTLSAGALRLLLLLLLLLCEANLSKAVLALSYIALRRCCSCKGHDIGTSSPLSWASSSLCAERRTPWRLHAVSAGGPRLKAPA